MTRSAVFAFGFVLACAGFRPRSRAGTTTPPPQTQARHPEEGRPFIRGYQPADVGGTGQIWSILQDRRGVLYAGGNSGVLEFDGSNWRRIKVGASATVRSLTMDASGRIYLGSADTFGYLAPDAQGELQFVTLKNKLPAAEQNFNDVWRAFAIDSGVYFQTEQAIFKWANDALTIIKPASRFNRLSMLDGRLYLTLPETGLNVLENDTFKPLPGTEPLALEPYPVILRYDAVAPVDRHADHAGCSSTTARRSRRFARNSTPCSPARSCTAAPRWPTAPSRSTTTANGLVIVDRQGRAVMHVNRANGLPSDVVYYAMPDKEGAVWLALDSGLARLEVPSPASFFDPQEGLPSQPFDMVRVDGRLYAAVQTGVFYLAPAGPGGETPRFQSIGVNRLAMLGVRQDAADRRRRPGGADHRVQRGALRDPRDDGARHLRAGGRDVPRGLLAALESRSHPALGGPVRRHRVVQAPRRAVDRTRAAWTASPSRYGRCSRTRMARCGRARPTTARSASASPRPRPPTGRARR